LDDIFVTFNLFNERGANHMNLKAPPLYILSFLLLVFLVQDVHDWAHVLAVRVTCHCWPVRTFGDWVLCGSPSAGQQALITAAGPLINVALFLTGWSLLGVENSVEEHSVGIALFFAAMPWTNLVAAFTGGGDITTFVRWIQRHGPRSNHSLASGIGLIVTLLIILPGLVRAFLRLPGYKGKLIAFPLLLLLPGWLVQLGYSLLNRWFIRPETGLWTAYAYVGAWSVVAAVGFFLTRRQLKGLITELSL
jgi:hypothetical protein